MSWVTWKPIKKGVCDRFGGEVFLEARVVYPATFLPDQAPRVLDHRCSQALDCNQLDKPACRWAGTLPGYDPFA
jgi:hypothetical protein